MVSMGRYWAPRLWLLGVCSGPVVQRPVWQRFLRLDIPRPITPQPPFSVHAQEKRGRMVTKRQVRECSEERFLMAQTGNMELINSRTDK